MAVPIAAVLRLEDHLLKILVGSRNQRDTFGQFLEKAG